MIALAGTIIYYNSNNEKENIAEEKVVEGMEENEKVEEQDEILEDNEKEYENEIEEDDIIVKEIYAYSDSNEFETGAIHHQKIGFSSDDKFLIKTSGFTITGECYLIDNNIKRCKIGRYPFEESDLFIDFKIIDDNKLKVISNNTFAETEFGIILSGEFEVGKEFIKYDINDFLGTWTSSYAYEAIVFNSGVESCKVENLTEIFGTSYINAGSRFTFNEDGSFEDYINPVTEGDRYRKGTYVFDITEVSDSAIEGIEYDNSIKTVTVIVTDVDEDGYLEISNIDELETEFVFENEY